MAPKLSKMAMKSAMKSVMKKAPSGKLAATSQAGKNKIPDDWGFGVFQDENGETYVNQFQRNTNTYGFLLRHRLA